MRIDRINQNSGNVVRLVQADMRPGGAGVSGLVNAIALRLLTRAYINNVRVRPRHGQGANGGNMHSMENGVPDVTAIGGLPHTAAGSAKVVDVWLLGDTGHARDPSAAMRTNQPPLQTGIKPRTDFLRVDEWRRKNNGDNRNDYASGYI